MLKEISQSLDQPTISTWKQRGHNTPKVKAIILQQTIPSLLEGLKLCDEIVAFIDNEDNLKKLQIAVDGAVIEVKKLQSKFADNLQHIDGVQKGLTERINRFDILEAKYTRMISNVNSVLAELDRVLKQM